MLKRFLKYCTLIAFGIILFLISPAVFAIDYHFVVAADGSGDFRTVQEAINAVPDFRKNETVIFIKKGTYKEKLVLAGSKTNVVFIGEDRESTMLTFDDFASKKIVLVKKWEQPDRLRSLFLVMAFVPKISLLPIPRGR